MKEITSTFFSNALTRTEAERRRAEKEQKNRIVYFYDFDGSRKKAINCKGTMSVELNKSLISECRRHKTKNCFIIKRKAFFDMDIMRAKARYYIKKRYAITCKSQMLEVLNGEELSTLSIEDVMQTMYVLTLETCTYTGDYIIIDRRALFKAIDVCTDTYRRDSKRLMYTNYKQNEDGKTYEVIEGRKNAIVETCNDLDTNEFYRWFIDDHMKAYFDDVKQYEAMHKIIDLRIQGYKWEQIKNKLDISSYRLTKIREKLNKGLEDISREEQSRADRNKEYNELIYNVQKLAEECSKSKIIVDMDYITYELLLDLLQTLEKMGICKLQKKAELKAFYK